MQSWFINALCTLLLLLALCVEERVGYFMFGLFCGYFSREHLTFRSLRGVNVTVLPLLESDIKSTLFR